VTARPRIGGKKGNFPEVAQEVPPPVVLKKKNQQKKGKKKKKN